MKGKSSSQNSSPHEYDLSGRGIPIPDKVLASEIRRLSEHGAKLMLYVLLSYFSGKERRNYGLWTRVLHILETLGLDKLDHPAMVKNPYANDPNMFKESEYAEKTERE
jgi:hypothetical protein